MRGLCARLALLGMAVLFTALLATGVAAAQTSTTSTTTPPPASTQPMLPTTANTSSMPHTGLDTAQLVGIATSCLLIGYGVCSLGRGVGAKTVP